MNEIKEKRSVLLPFDGFYNTIHGDLIDRALEGMFEDDHGHVNRELLDRANGIFDYETTLQNYSKAWVSKFEEDLGMTIKFDRLCSPKYYNYENDRLFGYMFVSDLQKIRSEASDLLLKTVAKEWFTSRSGFISHYSNNPENWGDFADWDHNQLGCLLEAYIATKDLEVRDPASIANTFYEAAYTALTFKEGEGVAELFKDLDK